MYGATNNLERRSPINAKTAQEAKIHTKLWKEGKKSAHKIIDIGVSK